MCAEDEWTATESFSSFEWIMFEKTLYVRGLYPVLQVWKAEQQGQGKDKDKVR